MKYRTALLKAPDLARPPLLKARKIAHHALRDGPEGDTATNLHQSWMITRRLLTAPRINSPEQGLPVLQDKQLVELPVVTGKVAEAVDNPAELSDRDPVLAAQSLQDAQAEDVPEEIDATEGGTPVFSHQCWRQEAGMVQISQLILREARQVRGLLLIEGGNDRKSALLALSHSMISRACSYP